MYPKLLDHFKQRALEHLGNTSFTPALRAFLEERILNETAPEVLTRAAYHLLRRQGLPRTNDKETARFSQLWSQLSDPSLETRQDALRTLKR